MKNKNQKKKKLPLGLKVRLLGAERLQEILRGKIFIPFSSTEIDNGRDRALANRLITYALRYHGHLNIIFEKTLTKGMPKKSGCFEASMRIGLCELLFMEEMAEHSSIFLAVEAIKNNKKSAHLGKLANGVLRKVQREKSEFTNFPLVELFPHWLQKRWRKSYGQEALNGFAKALLNGAPLDLTLKNIDDELVKELGAQRLIFDSVRIKKRDCPVAQLSGYEDGQWWVQDVASTLPARLMKLKSGARVLDMCAAPGGKTAQLIKQGYEVIALDIEKTRLDRLEQNLTRLNYKASLELADAIDYKSSEKFDGILLDAPCSSTGTFRRHPEILWQKRSVESKGRVELQKKLVQNAIELLKKGGILIYATCSLEQVESEEIAAWILENYPQMKKLAIKREELEGEDKLIDENGWLRATPDMKLLTRKEVLARQETNFAIEGLDGFFAARFFKE